MAGGLDIFSLPGFESEFAEAFYAFEQGDPWPLAVLECKAGGPQRLADLIAERGLAPGTEESQFVADVVAGRFRPTKKDRGALRTMEILMTVSFLVHMMTAVKEGRAELYAEMNDRLETMDDVYRQAALDFNLTAAGVQKIVERNRRRLRSPTMPRGSNVGDDSSSV